MNCIVCVTSVPDTASVIKIGSDGTNIDETGIKWIVSPFDEYALEEALQLTEAKGGEVTAVIYGPARAEAALRDCLARGAQKAVHVIGGESNLGDSFAIASVLSKALDGREYDLVLCGNMGVGTDCGQVGQMLAQLLDLPLQLPGLQSVANGNQHAITIEWLLEEVGGLLGVGGHLDRHQRQPVPAPVRRVTRGHGADRSRGAGMGTAQPAGLPAGSC